MGEDFERGYTSYGDDDDSFDLGAEYSDLTPPAAKRWRDDDDDDDDDNYMIVDLDQPRVQCGDVITGRARWSGPKDPRSVQVSLGFHTEGRGDRDSQDVAEMALPAGRSGDHAFELRVPPDGPMSYSGNLIRVIWEVELKLDLKARRDPKEQERIHVDPQEI